MKNVFPLTEQIASNVACFGEYDAARLMVSKMCFTHYYYLRFGCLPK